MTTLVVSGGIGSGKSALCAMLAERGIPVYDCDTRAKELYDSSEDLLPRIEAALGRSFRLSNGRLDRRALARCIFSSPDARNALEFILYPALLEDFKAWRSSREESVVALESAVILSKPVFDGVGDYVIWVDAPKEKRLSRVMSRDGLSSDEVIGRMNSQHSCAEKADIVIHNDGSLSSLSVKLDAVLKKLLA